MEIREMRMELGATQGEFADRYHIPFRTIQNWENGVRKPPAYIISLLEHQVKGDLINRKTSVLPKYDPKKMNLPKRENYIGALAWLKAVRDCIGEDIVFGINDFSLRQIDDAGLRESPLVDPLG